MRAPLAGLLSRPERVCSASNSIVARDGKCYLLTEYISPYTGLRVFREKVLESFIATKISRRVAELSGMEDDRHFRALLQAALWLVGGLVAGGFCLIYSSKDDLLVLLVGLYLFSIVAVGVSTFEIRKALGQLVLGPLLLTATALLFMNFDGSPVVAVMVGLSVVMGCANAFSCARLTLLMLAGQMVPIATVAFSLVSWHGASPKTVVVTSLFALSLCVVGSLISRSLPDDFDLNTGKRVSGPQKEDPSI